MKIGKRTRGPIRNKLIQSSNNTGKLASVKQCNIDWIRKFKKQKPKGNKTPRTALKVLHLSTKSWTTYSNKISKYLPWEKASDNVNVTESLKLLFTSWLSFIEIFQKRIKKDWHQELLQCLKEYKKSLNYKKLQ